MSNSGSYSSYTVPTSLTPSTNYRVRITSTSDSANNVYSGYFTVSVPNPTISLSGSRYTWGQTLLVDSVYEYNVYVKSPGGSYEQPYWQDVSPTTRQVSLNTWQLVTTGHATGFPLTVTVRSTGPTSYYYSNEVTFDPRIYPVSDTVSPSLYPTSFYLDPTSAVPQFWFKLDVENAGWFSNYRVRTYQRFSAPALSSGTTIWLYDSNLTALQLENDTGFQELSFGPDNNRTYYVLVLPDFSGNQYTNEYGSVGVEFSGWD